MKRNELIFIAVVIIAYIICALTLNIPTFVHEIFIILILALLMITIPLKYKQRLENDKIGKILYLLAIILLIFYIITTISEVWYGKSLIADSGIFLFSFIIVFAVSWFLRKN